MAPKELTPVKAGKELKVKFKGKLEYNGESFSGTWVQHFRLETAGVKIAQELESNDATKIVSVELVDYYELR